LKLLLVKLHWWDIIQLFLCSRLFPYLGLMKRHLKFHAGEKRYSCSLCTKLFTQSSNLKLIWEFLLLRKHIGSLSILNNLPISMICNIIWSLTLVRNNTAALCAKNHFHGLTNLMSSSVFGVKSYICLLCTRHLLILQN